MCLSGRNLDNIPTFFDRLESMEAPPLWSGPSGMVVLVDHVISCYSSPSKPCTLYNLVALCHTMMAHIAVFLKITILLPRPFSFGADRKQ